jgi:hypothetical protein
VSDFKERSRIPYPLKRGVGVEQDEHESLRLRQG